VDTLFEQVGTDFELSRNYFPEIGHSVPDEMLTSIQAQNMMPESVCEDIVDTADIEVDCPLGVNCLDCRRPEFGACYNKAVDAPCSFVHYAKEGLYGDHTLAKHSGTCVMQAGHLTCAGEYWDNARFFQWKPVGRPDPPKTTLATATTSSEEDEWEDWEEESIWDWLVVVIIVGVMFVGAALRQVLCPNWRPFGVKGPEAPPPPQ